MNFNDVLAQRLLGDKEFATLHARYVTDVLVHLDVVVIATALVRHEAAAVAAQHRHLVVHQHLVTREQVRCNQPQHTTIRLAASVAGDSGDGPPQLRALT